MASDFLSKFNLTPKDLQKYILGTYTSLRVGVGVLGVVFPFLLWIGGELRAHLPLQASMSFYYYADSGLMRDWFVGLLFATGIVLYLYKGFGPAEDWALNIGGVLAVGVAVFPMSLDPHAKFTRHGFCAVGLFLCMAFVALFCADDTVDLIRDTDIPDPETVIKRLKRLYNGIGIGMIVAITAAYVLNTAFATTFRTFWVEAAGIIFFGAYWLVKSWEIHRTAADLKTLRAETEKVGGKVRSITPQAFKKVP